MDENLARIPRHPRSVSLGSLSFHRSPALWNRSRDASIFAARSAARHVDRFAVVATRSGGKQGLAPFHGRSASGLAGPPEFERNLLGFHGHLDKRSGSALGT